MFTFNLRKSFILCTCLFYKCSRFKLVILLYMNMIRSFFTYSLQRRTNNNSHEIRTDFQRAGYSLNSFKMYIHILIKKSQHTNIIFLNDITNFYLTKIWLSIKNKQILIHTISSLFAVYLSVLILMP